MVAPGSKPLLFALFNILSGDVLLPRPSWVSYEPQVRQAGKRLFWVETDEGDRHNINCEPFIFFPKLTAYFVSVSALQSAYDKAILEDANPRVMLVNSPSNPTGQVFSEEVLAMLAKFCRERNLALISDEIYSDICFDPDHQASLCSGTEFNRGNLVITGGLSKVSTSFACLRLALLIRVFCTF